MKSYQKYLSFIFIITLFACNYAIAEEEKPSGTVEIDETQAMLIVGGSAGEGKLHFQGQSYAFTTGGVRVGGIGAHRIYMTGDVYHLNDIADFPGVYFQAEAGVTGGKKGAGAAWVKNSKGVSLHLKTSKEEGIALAIGAEGIKITMKE